MPIDSSSQQLKANILVVDDEAGMRDMLSFELVGEGYAVETAADGKEALAKIKTGKFRLVMCDMNMPEMSGLELLEAARPDYPDVEFIMMTGFGTVDSAVKAMKKGAYDFVQKPFDLREIILLVEKSLEKNELKTLMGVYEASRQIFKSMELDALLPTITGLSVGIFEADDASIMLVDDKGKLQLESSSGLEKGPPLAARLAMGERIASRVSGWKEPAIINGSLEDDPRFSGLSSLREIRSSIIFPFIMDDQLVGILNVNRTKNPHSFTQVDLRSATIVGSLAAEAIFNAKLYRQLETNNRELKEAKKKLETMQQQLVEREKLASIGHLSAGLAHELNNPLSGILGFTELLLDDSRLGVQQHQDLQTIHDQSLRCRNIIRNLLQFSRQKEVKMEPTDLLSVLKASIELVQYDFKTSGIDLFINLPESLPLILGDSGQLQQVFLNIITNARQAMEKKKSGALAISVFRDDKTISIQFKDNGRGIAPEFRSKIFDPFFTTKPPGQGTGLGLSICYGIMQQHQGNLRVESEVNKGTSMVVELPVQNEVEAHETSNSCR